MLPKSLTRMGDCANVTGPEPLQPVNLVRASAFPEGVGVVAGGEDGVSVGAGVEEGVDDGVVVVGAEGAAQPARSRATSRSAARIRESQARARFERCGIGARAQACAAPAQPAASAERRPS